MTWRSLITRDTEGLRKVWESRDAARAPGPSHGSLTRGQWNPVKFLEHLLGDCARQAAGMSAGALVVLFLGCCETSWFGPTSVNHLPSACVCVL